MVRFLTLIAGLAIASLLTVPLSAQQVTDTPAPGESPANGATDGDANPADDFSLGEVPAVETMELTADMAKRALDSYVVIRDKFKDAELENYDSLQEFVEQNAQGKAFEADVKAAGFSNVEQWNLAIVTLGIAYSNTLEDQTDDIKQQIDEVKNDGELAQDMKDRMTKSLEAMIPSANNAKIVEDLIADQTYAEKLKSLDVESE